MAQIIVGTDGSDGAAEALRWAVREGRIRGWPVRAVLAWTLLDQRQLDGTDTFDPHYDDDVALRALEAAVGQAVGADVAKVELRVVNDLPASALVAESANADLLVVGARGLDGFKSLLLGSVSSHSVQQAECPVVVVRPSAASARTSAGRVVVGVDGSEGAGAALRWALEAGRMHGATVEVIHAWQARLSRGPLAPSAAGLEAIESSARRTLDTTVEAADTRDVTVERTLVAGAGAGAILDAATDADLVVVGTRGRGRVRGLLMGSVSQQVTYHATCPVAVVPPTW